MPTLDWNQKLIVSTAIIGAFCFGIIVSTPDPALAPTPQPDQQVTVSETGDRYKEDPNFDFQLSTLEGTRDEYTVTPAPEPITVIPSPVERPFYEYLTPCEQEDSGQFYDCYWDASTRGNGLGTSFYAVGGVFYWLDGTPIPND